MTAATPVLVLNYNGWADSIACITTLRPYIHSIWLIDNGSDEDRTGELATMFPGLRTIRLEENLGWAGAYNRALKLAVDEGLPAAFLLNNDAVIERGGLEAACRELDSNPDAAAVGAVILSEDGASLNFAGEYFMFMTEEQRAAPPPTETVEARTLHGAGVLINLRAFKELGPFHEDYFLYWEETDWFVRARRRGWRLLVCGRSRVSHRLGGSDRGNNADYYRARNRFLAYRRGVSVSGRKETIPDLAASLLGKARSSDRWKRAAIENGVLDGLRGRFGKRRPPRPPGGRILSVLLLGQAILLYRILRKARLVGRSDQ